MWSQQTVHERRRGKPGEKKINDLATNSKDKNIRDLYRGINEFKVGY
jgi:hypothetical protein